MILLIAAALAGDHHVVRPNETVASIATAAGSTEAEVRTLNGLPAGAEPAVGVVLRLPGGEDPGGMILALSGSVTLSVPGLPDRPGVEGDALPVGSMVCTAGGSYATLRVGTDLATRSHDEVSLLGGTCVRLDDGSARAGRRASLLTVDRGSISVRDAEDQGVVTVLTKNGITTASGGGFRVTVEGAATRTEALDHDLSVLGGGAEQPVPAGYGSRVRPGEAPDTPIPLLPPGTPTTPLGEAPTILADFRWTPVERALAYRVEIAVAEDFSDLVMVEEINQEEWSPEVLLLPYRVPGLWWRVASVDRTGFIGRPSTPGKIGIPTGIGP